MGGPGQSSTSPRLTRRGAFTLALVLAVAASLVGAAVGASARGLTTGIIDYQYLVKDPQARARALAETKAADAGLVRLNVVWRQVAPSRPANPTDPADPAYRFRALDAAIEDAAAHGFKLLLTVYSAPAWAGGPGKPAGVAAGTWRPEPKPFGAFAQALARRYSGRFRPTGGTRLPAVHRFEAWDEPNLESYLAPQRQGRKPASPGVYRTLLHAFYSGVKKAQPKATVVGGATIPYGGSVGSRRMRPLTFFENLFCLNGKLKPLHCG